MHVLAISVSDSFQRTFDRVGDFLPRLIGAVAIFLIGWFVARVIRRVVHRVLTQVNIGALVDRSGLSGPLEQAGFGDAARLLAGIVYFAIMLVVVSLTADALGIEAIKDLIDDFVAFLPKLLVAIILIFITGAVANFVRGLVGRLTATQEWGELVTNLAVAGVWLIGIFAALDQVQVAQDIVDTLFQVIIGALGLILVIKFGVGGIWAARDRFWPAVYDRLGSAAGTPVDDD